ncbi:hypothetical protein [Desulfitobacterium dehalogenans]|uniref:hypothetical protein n=1 Tax=Desulfitobacterium dehalogenans TaxID=36854 RepID=UPI0002498BF3|nr:hypothetical protein [Desulfitobacterium dehalogenans]
MQKNMEAIDCVLAFLQKIPLSNSSIRQYKILEKNWDGIRSIKVNPNYLREFLVYDAQNNPVQIIRRRLFQNV